MNGWQYILRECTVLDNRKLYLKRKDRSVNKESLKLLVRNTEEKKKKKKTDRDE